MIEVVDLHVVRGGAPVLQSLDLAVPKGSITGLLGPNGAGKSTLLQTIAGILPASRGSVRIDGVDYPDEWLASPQVGVFLSAEWIPGRLRASDFLRFHADLLGVDGSPDESLELVGLGGHGGRRIRTFSLGMRQRLGLAAALLGEPAVLLLDEPVNGVDPEGIQWFRQTLLAFAGAGGTALVSSHLMAELEHFADRIAVMQGGHVVRSDGIDRFRQKAKGEVLVVTDDRERSLAFLVGAGFTARADGDRVTVDHDDPAFIARLLVEGGFALSHLSRVNRTLEEGYFDALASSGVEAGR